MTGVQSCVMLGARLMLALLFINSASDKFRLNPVELQQIASLHLPFPKTIERMTGGFEILAALSLVFGVYARVSAGILVLFLGFLSFAFVRFWSFDGSPDVRGMLRNLFFGNIAVLGGLLYIAAIGAGPLAIIDL